MCGRFTQHANPKQLAKLFDLDDELPLYEPRFNIAPTQGILAVRRREDRPAREATIMRWGLIPSWAKDPSVGNSLINARAETVAHKPSFRSAFKRRRCLIAADGFYEWAKVGRKKQPYHFRVRGGEPFAFAGLWESWKPPTGERIETCTIITTDANELVKPVHERMPVILPREEYGAWLDPAIEDADRLLPLLRPYPSDDMDGYPVGQQVNSPRHDDPACIEPLDRA